MNELLQRHGCSNVFTVPEGLRELMSDITREVLREQPEKILDFIANYLSVLLITREHGVMAVKILDDLCDCRPSVSEHLLQLGLEHHLAENIAEVIKEQIESTKPEEGKEKVREGQILKKILLRHVLDEDTTAKVSQVARNAYRDYWYRKLLLQESLKDEPDQPWEIAAQRTLNIYKKTKPSFDELTRATLKIQAAYKGYYVRRNLLRHLKPKPKPGPKVELPGPPVDVAESREIDLGRVIDIKVKEDRVGVLFDADVSNQLSLGYDPMRTITHITDDEAYLDGQFESAMSQSMRFDPSMSQSARFVSSKSLGGRSDYGMSKLSQAGSKEDRRASRPSILVEPGPRSRLTSEVGPASTRPSRAASVMSETARSRLMSQVPPGEAPSHALSFAAEPPEMITADAEHEGIKEVPQVEEALPAHAEGEEPQEAQQVEEAQQVHEDQQVEENQEAQEAQEAHEAQEVQEAIEAETPAQEAVAQEVPEDIAAPDRTEADGASGLESSAATTVPETGDSTDVEDAGDLNTTGEEEGE